MHLTTLRDTDVASHERLGNRVRKSDFVATLLL